MGSARNSADATQLIGRYLVACSSGALYGYCQAQSPATPIAPAAYASCSFSAPAIVSVVSALGTDSQVSFGWDASGTCTYVTANNASTTEPKN